MSLVMGRTTSASNKKVVVSDQLRTNTLKWPPSCESFSCSIFVKGHGPAMQETLTLRNSFPSPASRDTEPIAAFHLPPGAHGGRLSHGVFPMLITWNVFTAVPIFASVVAFTEYLIRAFETTDPEWDSAFVSWWTRTMRAI